jgi:transposase-like protein
MPERRGGNKVGAAGRRRAVKLRARGLTITEVARRLGVTRQAVQYMLRKAEAEGKQP